MKLATKLVTVFMIIILSIIAVDLVFAIRAESNRANSDLRQEVTEMGMALRELLLRNTDLGEPRVAEHLARLNTAFEHVSIRWVSFEVEGGTPLAPMGVISMEQMHASASGIVFTNEVGGDPSSLLAYVYVPTAFEGGLEIRADRQRVARERAALNVRAFRVAGLLVLLSGVSAVWLGQKLIAGPLELLIEKTRRIGDGGFDDPVKIGGRDELSELGDAMNTMCGQLAAGRKQVEEETARRIEALSQLRHADRLRTVGRLASGIAHELGTPLAVVSGRAEMIANRDMDHGQVVDNARIIKEQVDRISGIVRHLMDFARAHTPERTAVDLRTVVEHAVELMGPVAHRHRARIVTSLPNTPATASIDAGQIQQVLANLLVNAMHAMPDGGPIAISASRVERTPGDAPDTASRPFVRLSVRDEGTGIHDEHLEHVFDPFFTTKDVGEGTGMGLSVVYGIVQEHGGWIDVDTAVGRGTEFSVYLPAEDDP